MADVRCPNCGKINPEDAEICQFCFTQLKEEEQPDWLSRIRERSKQDKEQDEPEEENEAEPAIELPDWLTAREEPENEHSLDESDDWLANLRAKTFEDEPNPDEAASSTTPGEASIEEMPDWLQTLHAESDARESPPVDLPTAADSGLSDLPDWLKDLSTPQQPVPAVALPDMAENAIEPEQPVAEPLSTVQGQNEAQKEIISDANPAAIEEVQKSASTPAAQLPSPDVSETPSAPVETSALTTGEAIAGTEPQEFGPAQPLAGPESGPAGEPAGQESVQPAGPLTPPETEEPPDWFAHLQEQETTLPGSPSNDSVPVFTEEIPANASGDQVNPFSSDDLPEWLARMNPPDEEIVAEAPEAQTPKEKDEEITLAPAELPSWVQAMRPIETATPEAPLPPEEDEHVEKLGPLAGLRGILPAEVMAPEIRKPPTYPVTLQVPDKQKINAALFESILAAEVKPHPIGRERTFSSQRLVRIAIALVLILAVWFPLWQGSQSLGLPGYLPSEIGEVQATINAMPAGSTVLLAVDYNPALAGEVDAVASSVVAHLMSKSANIVLISTNPMGPVLGEQLLTTAQQNQSGYSIASHTLDLGYLAGGPSGLYDFAIQPQAAAPVTVEGKNAWEQPILKGKSLSDFAAVFVVTESADTARTWVEQVKPALGSAPLFMVTSAQAAPVIRPYYNAGQIQGFVSGLAGGAIYEQASSLPGTSLQYWDSFQAGVLIAVALAAIGGLIAVGKILFTRQKPRGEE